MVLFFLISTRRVLVASEAKSGGQLHSILRPSVLHLPVPHFNVA